MEMAECRNKKTYIDKPMYFWLLITFKNASLYIHYIYIYDETNTYIYIHIHDITSSYPSRK